MRGVRGWLKMDDVRGLDKEDRGHLASRVVMTHLFGHLELPREVAKYLLGAASCRGESASELLWIVLANWYAGQKRHPDEYREFYAQGGRDYHGIEDDDGSRMTPEMYVERNKVWADHEERKWARGRKWAERLDAQV